MSVGTSLMEKSQRPWYVLTLLTSFVLALALGGLHFLDRSRLDAADRIVRQHGHATADLTLGFLHYSLDTNGDGPWERQRGLAILAQSVGEFADSAKLLPRGSELADAFQSDLANFQQLLRQDTPAADRGAHELALRVALGRLQSSAEAVDAQLRGDLIKLGDDQEALYRAGMVFAVLLILLLVVVTLRTLRDRRTMFYKIAEQEALFRSLVEQSLAGICMVRKGTVRYANARTAEIMGTTAAQLIGRPVLDYIIPAQQARGKEALQQLLRGEIQHYMGSFISPRDDGSEIEFDVQANLINIDGEPEIVAVLQDVSERQRLQRERLATLRLLEAITNSSSDAIFAKDKDGRFILFNAECARLAGASADSAKGLETDKVFQAEEAAKMLATDQQVLREGKLLRSEMKIAAPDGIHIIDTIKGPLFAEDGSVAGLFGVGRDITRRKAQERALEESQAQLSTVVDALDEGLVVFDPQGNLIRMNPAACRITGVVLRPGEPTHLRDLAQQLIFETLDGTVLEVSDWPSQRLLRGESIHLLELVLRRRDKAWHRVLAFNGSPVRDANGQLRLVMATFTDVTLRKQAEAAMLQAQRMESLGTLAAGIAHDFNNLLLAISGNAALASAEVGASHPAHESLAEVMRAGQRASDLVRRILLFARAEDARRTDGDLRSLVEEALQLLKATVPASIRLRASYGAAAGAVNMDSSQIHQVIVNLVTNAVHAIEAGPSATNGEISVELKTVDLPAGTVIGDQQLAAGQYACLSVTDNGCGMEPTILTRIFDPFFTTKPVGRGTGLGLPMVHGIVQDHGGAVGVTSRAGSGTRMDVYLPLVQVAALAAQDKSTPVSHGQGQHVLYLDDEAALVFLVTRYLRKQGYTVAGFCSPAEAVAEFLAHPELYDVVITDLSMPGMSGFDVARTMRAVKPQLPVILLSGFVRPEDHATAASVGVTQVLLKPSTVEELGRAIDRELR